MTKTSQETLINFAMRELANVLTDIQAGKEPHMSTTGKKLMDVLESARTVKMTDEEAKKFADAIVSELPNLEET